MSTLSTQVPPGGIQILEYSTRYCLNYWITQIPLHVTYVYKPIFPLTIMDIIMNYRYLPSPTGRPSPGDCHVSYIHGRLPSSTYGRTQKC